MPVALDDLGADRVGVQAQGGQDLGLELGVEMAVGADRAGDLAGPDLVHGAGQADPIAGQLEGPAGELQAERGRLGVDRMGPAHHHRVGLGPGPGDQGDEQAVGVDQEALAGRPELQGEGGVDDVAAGQAEVEIAALRARRSRRPG